MPTINIGCYIKDKQFNKYLMNKAFINEKVREVVNEELKKINEGDE